MYGFLNFFTFNLILFPVLSLLLLLLIPPGNLLLFRLLSFISLVTWNILFLKKFKLDFKINKPNSMQILSVIAFFAGVYAIFFRFSLQPEGGSWDAFGMWNVKSRDYVETFLNGEGFKLIFSDWVNPSYPIFIPLSITFFQINMGEWNYYIPMVYHTTIYLFHFIIIFNFLKDIKKGILPVYLILNIFLILPIITSASNQIADFPISVFICLVVYFIHKLESTSQENRDSRDIIMLSIALFAVLHIKEEGMILAGISVGFLFIFTNLRSDKKLLKILIPTLFLGIILLGVYKKISPVTLQFTVTPKEIWEHIFDWKRYSVLMKYYLYHQQLILYSDIIVLSLCLVFMRANRKYLLIPISISLVYFGILIITTFNQEWQVVTASGRLQTQALQVLYLVALILYEENNP